MKEHQTMTLPTGTRLQSGIPKRPRGYDLMNPKGLLLRGVVLVTYVSDDENHPKIDENTRPVSVYCDVFVYSDLPNYRNQILNACLVLQDSGRLHSGKIWKPKATSTDFVAGTFDADKAINPANLDGEHVLVAFMDGSFNQAVILGGIPHPSNDVGNESLDVGQRKILKVADGDPQYWKHKGLFFGMSDSGDFVIDTTLAHDGTLQADGKEPAPAEDGSSGNVIAYIQTGSTLTVSIGGGETFEIALKDANATLKIGDGAKHVAVVEHLETLYGQLKSYIEGAKVPTAMGPSGTILAGSGPAPSWNSSINSTHVSIPDA